MAFSDYKGSMCSLFPIFHGRTQLLTHMNVHFSNSFLKKKFLKVRVMGQRAFHLHPARLWAALQKAVPLQADSEHLNFPNSASGPRSRSGSGWPFQRLAPGPGGSPPSSPASSFNSESRVTRLHCSLSRPLRRCQQTPCPLPTPRSP